MERNVPMQAASRSSIQNMKARTLPVIFGPTMATGKRSAVMATRKSEIPSIPRYQRMPRVSPV